MQTKKREKRSSLGEIMPSDKKGQLSVQMIIIIILGVAVLVFAIIWVVTGGKLFSAWFPSNNVETIVNQCSTSCATSSKYDYCSKIRVLKDEKLEIESNCATFSVISEYSKYGIEECSVIDCDFECGDVKVGKEGEQKEGHIIEEGKDCPKNEEDITSIAYVSGGQKCCIEKLSE